MKLLILTQPLKSNYGGILQAYALQTVLKKMGHEVWVENRLQGKLSLLSRIKLKVFYYINRFIRKKHYPNKSQEAIIYINTISFIKNYINLTVPVTSITKEELSNYNFDGYIVGSDQVWRPKYSYYLPNYYLDFVKGDSVKRIAYAASFGTDLWEYSDNLTRDCKLLIKKFNAVSVRESYAVNLVERHFDVDAVHVLDPTMLLSPPDYLNLCEENLDRTGEDVVVYILDPCANKTDIVNKVKSYYNCSIACILPQMRFRESGPDYIDQCVYPSVTEWIKRFYSAKFVVTDSFHGTVFSIIFNKNFVTIANSERGISRFKSLLTLFHLEDRLIQNSENLTHKILSQNIDYDSVNAIMHKEQEKSFEYLRNSLR